jgi:hypothetical protein
MPNNKQVNRRKWSLEWTGKGRFQKWIKGNRKQNY